MDRKLLLGILLLVALVGVFIGYRAYSAKTPTASERATDVTVDATALFTAFVTDEIAAGKTYTDKVLQVSGRVRDVSQGSDGIVNVTLETGDALGGVVCEFTVDRAPKWKKDSQVTVKGICAGYNMDVLLQRCAAVE